MDLWFAQYLVCDGEKHLQGTQVKDHKDRNCYCQLLLSIIIIIYYYYYLLLLLILLLFIRFKINVPFIN